MLTGGLGPAFTTRVHNAQQCEIAFRVLTRNLVVLGSQ